MDAITQAQIQGAFQTALKNIEDMEKQHMQEVSDSLDLIIAHTTANPTNLPFPDLGDQPLDDRHAHQVAQLVWIFNGGSVVLGELCTMTAEGMRIVMDALLEKQEKPGPHQPFVSLECDWFFDNAGAKVVADAIHRGLKIKKLSLSRSLIDDDGTAAIAAAIKATNHLTHLDLECNLHGEAGLLALHDAIKTNTNIVVFLGRPHEDGPGGLNLDGPTEAWANELARCDEILEKIDARVDENRKRLGHVGPQPTF